MSFSRESFIKEAISAKRSEGFIKKTLAYADKLVANGIPVIFSRRHLSLLIGVEYHLLSHIMQDREAYYTYYPIKKRSGGVRQISSPYSNLKEIQRWINTRILAKIPVSDQATGFVKKRSIFDNAKPHEGKKYIIKLDLLKFFDSITEFRISKVFMDMGYAPNVAVDLARLTTVPLNEKYYDTFSPRDQDIFKKYFERQVGVLPQGAPTSPMLSNIILKNLDQRLFELAIKRKFSYTRYADDMTFSADETMNLPTKNELVSVIKAERVYANYQKFAFYKRGEQRTVTGLTVTNGIHIPKSYRRDIERHLFFCKKSGPMDHQVKLGIQDKKFFKEWLLGRIHYVSSIDTKAAEKMYKLFGQIDWPL